MPPQRLTNRRPCTLTALALAASTAAFLHTAVEASGTVGSERAAENGEAISYEASFFDRYAPTTALDMVRQLPGFKLDDGDDQRGFGSTTGNILINDRYPITKQDAPSNILARIPAVQVKKIELIRGQVRNIDMRGQSIVANLVLRDDAGAAARWELALRKNFNLSQLIPVGSISVSHQWGDIDYSAGLDGLRMAFAYPGIENIFDSAGQLIARRSRAEKGIGPNANGYFSATSWLGETLLKFNSTLGFEVRDEKLAIHELLQDSGEAGNELFDTRRYNRTSELSFAAERMLQPDLLGTAILVHHRLDQRPASIQRQLDQNGEQVLYRRADTDSKATENIGRLELGWSAIRNHLVQFNVEAAQNILDSRLIQVVDTGQGPVVAPVPGSDTRVEEVRGDFLISDTLTFGDAELDYGLGAEISRISQSGDEELERSFTFLKPHAVLTYSASQAAQTLVRVAREVSQLDFNDFVSATVFEDNDLALGNPNLRPATSWIAEFSQEWRYGDSSVFGLKVFHHWISDVEDLLPLDLTFEVPGNIGDGRRWGMELETAFPLHRVGFENARIEIKARLQDSTVVDPVTANDRVLSSESGHKGDILFRNENLYSLFVDFRQDFDRSRVSWGWHVAWRAERPLYKVNELDIYSEGVNIDTFIESTRWLGMKVRLSGQNILNYDQFRNRTVYKGARGLSPVSFRELHALTKGTRLELSLSGAF